MSSVYDRNRSHTGFTPIDNAADLMDEVTRYVIKEKYVSKKLRYLLGDDLIRKADEIYDNVTFANEIYASKENIRRRRAYWNRAVACCKQLDRKLQRLRKRPQARIHLPEDKTLHHRHRQDNQETLQGFHNAREAQAQEAGESCRARDHDIRTGSRKLCELEGINVAQKRISDGIEHGQIIQSTIYSKLEVKKWTD